MADSVLGYDGSECASAALGTAERPATALLELAKERGARLIVVGTTSERPIASAILGSVPHKLLRRSDRPVLVVPANVRP